MGGCDERILVKCPGGDIAITVDDSFAVTMTGPATRVGAFEMDGGVPGQDVPL